MRTTTPDTSLKLVIQRAAFGLFLGVALVLAILTHGDSAASAPTAADTVSTGSVQPTRTDQVDTVASTKHTTKAKNEAHHPEWTSITAKSGAGLKNHRFKSRGTKQPKTPKLTIAPRDPYTTHLVTH
jgi:hypothetical protein